MRASIQEGTESPQRFGATSHYRYILYAVNVVLLASTIAVMEWQRRDQESVTDRMNGYHLATEASAFEARKQMHDIRDALTDYIRETSSAEAIVNGQSFSTAYPDARSALYVAESEIAKMVEIQSVFRDDDFEQLITRIKKDTSDLSVIIFDGIELQSDAEVAQRHLTALALSLEQTIRLHSSEYSELTKAHLGQESRQTLILIAIVIGLLAISIVVMRRILKFSDQATEVLRENEQRLQKILDGIFTFVGVYTIDGVLIRANKAPLEAASLSPEDVLGKPFWDTYWWSYSTEVQDQLRDALGRAAKGETVRYDVPIRVGETEDGNPQLRIIDATFGPLHDSHGDVINLIGSAVDITERKEAEEALSKSEASLSKAQRVAHVGNWDWNIETGELSWSDEIFRIFGLAPQQFGATYEAFLQTIHPEDRELVEQAVNDAVQEGREYDIVHRIVLPTEEVRTVHERGEVTFDSAGAPLRMIGTVQDITERRKAELALQQSEQQLRASLNEKEVLLKETHHRVKNNLQIISSLLNLQSVQIEDEQAQNVFADSISRVSAIALIHEKLYCSENLAEIDFGDYIRSLIDSLSDSFGDRVGGVKLDVAAQDVYLDVGTAIPCALIVNELVSNAWKHAFRDENLDTNGSPKISVEFTRDGERGLMLRVADNGCGLPKDLDFRDTESLGLQIVITLIEQLDGEIELDSENGATFTIKFEGSKEGAGV